VVQSASSGSYHVQEKRAETTQQQDGARGPRKLRHQRCHESGENNDCNDRKRQRAIVDEQSD
jgi:hypothetical protein